MKVIIEASEKEIADLILRLQGQQEFMIDELIKEIASRLSKETAKGGVIPL